ncbi:motility associated factor glycosyltransferase family protein [Tepidibacillus fermentans]|uniref:6-hydroxymethylpterin diphosphokinase MptE-like domain-containing protein n=1 Tax=Tepidibacillus fermentans TaxID=1281767 RepID=A0A4R3KJ70_9BACI|nr:6-hydroxymethylpterin diphosphokinase MptE-like protein [Tepidibacillus fermentans]TCS83315.1 hypothetical protein EDD72_10555 [Tepidibacillus fermentans]
MNIFKKNIEVFKKKYHYDPYFEDYHDIVVEPTRKEDSITLKYKIDNKFYYLHSLYDPKVEADNIVENLYEEGNLYIIIGLGLGYIAKSLLKRIKDSDYIFIIEPSNKIFTKCMELVDIHELIEHKQVFLYIDRENKNEISYYLNQLVRQRLFNHFKLYISRNYDKLFPEKVLSILEKIKEAIKTHQINLNTTFLFSEEWQLNYLKNLKHSIKAIPFNKFKNFISLPAIIVSAGPSLMEEIDKLRLLKNKALIIASGSAVTTLEYYQIKPHIIVSIDGGVVNYEHFKKINYTDVPLFYAPMINHKILDEYRGPKVIFQGLNNEINEWYNKLLGFETGEIALGPSVANVALDIACNVTSGPICFIGQDLGFSNGYSHALGNINRTKISYDNDNTNLLQVDSNDGGKIYTNYVYNSMRKWFEDYIQEKNLINIYNATKKGAKIKGTNIIDFDEFINKFCISEVNVEQELANKLNNSPNNNIDREKLIKENLEILNELIEITFKAMKLSRELLESINKNNNIFIGKIIKQLDNLDNKLFRIEKKDLILFYIKQPILLRLESWKTFSDKNESLNIAKKNLFFYEQLYDIGKKVKEIFEILILDGGQYEKTTN